jgi:uncharacterized RDD family membrane protein YckC
MLESEPAFLTQEALDRPSPMRARGTASPFPRTEHRPRFEAAGLFRRSFGALIDLTILLPIVLLLGFAASLATGIELPAARHHSVDFWLDLALTLDPALCGIFILLAITFFAYATVFQALLGRTVGMMVTRLRVIDLYGDSPGFGRALARSASYFASVATLGLGFLWIAFDAEHRGLHDHLSRTHVVKV